jgi:hypothetical protein
MHFESVSRGIGWWDHCQYTRCEYKLMAGKYLCVLVLSSLLRSSVRWTQVQAVKTIGVIEQNISCYLHSLGRHDVAVLNVIH